MPRPSLIVLPGLADPEAFKGVRQSLALSLALPRVAVHAERLPPARHVPDRRERRGWQPPVADVAAAPAVHLVAKVNPTRAQQ